MENDVYRKPGDRCLFPPRAGMAYGRTADSETAIRHFLKYLERKPAEVEWLLNMSYVTLGKPVQTTLMLTIWWK